MISSTEHYGFRYENYAGFTGIELNLGPISMVFEEEMELKITNTVFVQWGFIYLQEFKLIDKKGQEIHFHFYEDEDSDDDQIVILDINSTYSQTQSLKKDDLKDFAVWLWSQNHDIDILIKRYRELGAIRSKIMNKSWVKKFEEAVLEKPKEFLKPLSARIRVFARDKTQNAVQGLIYYALTGENKSIVHDTEAFTFDGLVKKLAAASRDGSITGLKGHIVKIVFKDEQKPVEPVEIVSRKRNLERRERRNSLGG